MRNPLRSEREAFGVLLLALVLVGAIAVGGVLGGGWVAVGMLVGILLGGAAAFWLARGPAPSRPAWWERPVNAAGEPGVVADEDAVSRLLVLADEALGADALRQAVIERVRADGEVLVVAPAISTASSAWSPQGEERLAQAEARAAAIVALLEARGLRARAELDEDDPVRALDRALRSFAAETVVVGTRPVGDSPWLEAGVVDAVRRRVACPVVHVVCLLA